MFKLMHGLSHASLFRV